MGYFVMWFIGIFVGASWVFITIDAEEINKINNTCTNNGGVVHVVASLPRINVYCKDGAEFRLKD